MYTQYSPLLLVIYLRKIFLLK